MRNIGVTYEMTARADTHSKVERLKHSRVAGMCCIKKNKHTESSIVYQVLNSIISLSFLPLIQWRQFRGFEALSIQVCFWIDCWVLEGLKGFLWGCFACLHCGPQYSCQRITDRMQQTTLVSAPWTGSAVWCKHWWFEFQSFLLWAAVFVFFFSLHLFICVKWMCLLTFKKSTSS